MERTYSLFPDFQARDSFHFAPMWENHVGGDPALTGMYQPDLVIEETLERFLPRFFSTNVPD